MQKKEIEYMQIEKRSTSLLQTMFEKYAHPFDIFHEIIQPA
jgi:hypothetical protein